jgi:hypothetical protein
MLQYPLDDFHQHLRARSRCHNLCSSNAITRDDPKKGKCCHRNQDNDRHGAERTDIGGCSIQPRGSPFREGTEDRIIKPVHIPS